MKTIHFHSAPIINVTWCDDFTFWSESHTSYELCSLSI